MDFQLTAEEIKFQKDVSAFLDENIPGDWVPKGFIFMSEDEWAIAREFDRRVGQRKWLAPSWSREYGGLNFDPVLQMILDEQFALKGAPDGGGRGHGPHFVGPAILRFGTSEQRQKYLPPIVEGTQIWAQCFSEDEAGSDMANVRTTAQRDGDDYILNGTKLWTGQGHRADYAIVTARTSDAPKHGALSLLIVDLHSEGVQIDPIWTLPRHGRLNMEVFDQVRVPAANLLGAENEAWPIMIDVMNHERSGIAGPAGARRTLTSFVRSAKDGELGLGLVERENLRHQVVDILIEIEIATLMNYRIAQSVRDKKPITYESSIIKLMGAHINQSLAVLMISTAGLRGLLPDAIGTQPPSENWIGDYWLQSVQASIVSGTSEIMRNVIATRGLGLPRS